MDNQYNRNMQLTQKIIMVLLTGLILLIVSTNLVSPYYNLIHPFNIDLNLIYLLILLLAVPFIDDIIEIRYKNFIFTRKQKMIKKEIKEISNEAQFFIEAKPKGFIDNKLNYILENKSYLEGFAFFTREFEKELKNKLKSKSLSDKTDNNLNIKNKSLRILTRKAFEKDIISTHTYKKLRLFSDVRNRIIHFTDEEILEDDIRNILTLASSILRDLRGEKNAKE